METRFLEAYASSEPLHIPVHTVSAEELAETRAKLQKFQSELLQNSFAEPIELTASELNTAVDLFFWDTTGLEPFPIAIKFAGERLHVETSIPLSAMGEPNKYANASLLILPILEQESLQIEPTEFMINGKPAPDEAINQLSRLHLTSTNSQTLNKFAENVEKISIVGDKLTIYPKRNSSDLRSGLDTGL